MPNTPKMIEESELPKFCAVIGRAINGAALEEEWICTQGEHKGERYITTSLHRMGEIQD